MNPHPEKQENKERRGIWLMYFLYKNEHSIFKPAEITIKRILR
jgi:hypothetical protein